MGGYRPVRLRKTDTVRNLGRVRKNAWQNLGLAALTVVTLAGVVYLFGTWPPEPPHSTAAVKSVSTPAATPSPTAGVELPADPLLWIVGDSFTEGVGASQTSNGYAHVAADRLGWRTRIDGVGGSGYTTGGGEGADAVYEVRIRRMLAGDWQPHLVLLQGGLNDFRATPEQLQQAFTADVTLLRERLPGVEVVAFGPVASHQNNTTTANLDDTIEQAAEDANVPYISPIDQDWITAANTDRYISDDGYHPTDAGHAYLGRRLAAAIAEMSE